MKKEYIKPINLSIYMVAADLLKSYGCLYKKAGYKKAPIQKRKCKTLVYRKGYTE